MAIPTLIVGLGGTGVLTVRALKRLHAEQSASEIVPAGFLAIDFDRSATDEATDGNYADLEDGEFLYLRPQNIQDPLANLDRAQDGRPAWERVHKWFPSREDVQIPKSEVEANGAGQFRALGRLGLFTHVVEIENALRKALEDLPCESDSKTFTRDRRVIIAASLAGGTGSGMLIDMAYLIRRQPSQPRVSAYLMLPEIFAEVDQGGRIYQNAYAALRELAHFKDQQIPFRADYWRAPPIDIPIGGEEPFTRIFLFGRQLCSGGSPVAAACRNTAKTILAQLNRTIQEKTLAVVANTSSADFAEERRRRRTHCFSTAGSDNLRLGMEEINTEVVLRDALLALGSDERLRKVFKPALDGVTEQSKRALDPTDSDQESETSSPESETAESEKSTEAGERARSLARKFTGAIEVTAEDGRDRVLAWLHSELDHVHTAAAVDIAEIADRAGQAIENLYEILLKSAEEEQRAERGGSVDPQSEHASGGSPQEPPAAVEGHEGDANSKRSGNSRNQPRTLESVLKDFRLAVPPFADIERSIHRTITNLLQLSQDVQSPREIMLRHLFLSELLRDFRFFMLFKIDEAPRNALREQWQELERVLSKSTKQPWWKNIFSPKQKQKLLSVGRAVVLRQAIKLPELATSLKALFLARAAAELRGRLQREKNKLERKVEQLRKVWTVDLIDVEALPKKQLRELPPALRSRLDTLLQAKAPEILREAQEKLQSQPDDERKRRILRNILEHHILGDATLRAARFLVDEDDGSAETAKKKIISNFVAARQDLFVRRTPNPQRKGFSVILAPEGIVWPDGTRRLHRFLDTSAEQILECRSQTVSYRGDRLWFYYEDLFNPPEHIRNLDDYYHSYKSQAHPELFHIDRRLLEDDNFQQIYAGSHRLVVSCGNEGCGTNIAYEDRTLAVCPGCQRSIRSRCGNPSCTLDDVHRHARGTDKSCPGCGGFNHGAWWRCERHGKQEVLVPLDKPRCPQCVMLHHEDPVVYPEDEIGRRPDTIETIECPHCASMRRDDPRHESFRIRADLLPFYRHGVNGHDRERFLRLAQRYKLPDDFRCPRCRTALIPFHHRELQTERYA